MSTGWATPHDREDVADLAETLSHLSSGLVVREVLPRKVPDIGQDLDTMESRRGLTSERNVAGS